MILCNIPNFVHEIFRGASLGTLFYYLVHSLLLVYYFFNEKNKIVWPFLAFALLYFSISGMIFVPDETVYFNDFVKYLIIVVCGGELARTTKLNELYIILIIGGASILIHSLLFVGEDGRYSGFYIDPNSAGFLCLLGCALSYNFKIEKIKLIGFFFFTFCGILTLSRTFLLLWVVMVIVSIFMQVKNFKVLAIGVGSLLLIMSTATIFDLNTIRFSFLANIFEGNLETSIVTQDSRTEVWELYYDKIGNNPIFGNGYQSFTGRKDIPVGVHNAYLRVIGESGIIPFLIFTLFYLYLFISSIKYFKNHGYLFLMVFSIMALLLTNHNFVINNHITIISLWIFYSLNNKSREEPEPSIIYDS